MDAAFEKEIGARIKKYRMAQDLTQEDMARMLQLRGCDLNRSTYAKIEVGKRHIYPDEIKALKEILKISYEDIFEK